MTEDDVRQLCGYTRGLCNEIANQSRLLNFAIENYAKGRSGRNDLPPGDHESARLRQCCLLPNQFLIGHFCNPEVKRLDETTDWPLVDAIADGRGVQSAMKMTWRLAADLINSVRNVLGADSHELDSAVVQLEELPLPTNKLMDEISIEEGHLVKWFREQRDQIVNGHLGLQVNYKSKLVWRKNVADVRVDLSGKPVAWLLFTALFEAADKGVMTTQLDNMLKNSERDADGRRQAIQSLKTDLIALKVKIPNAQKTRCYVLIDDQKEVSKN